MRKFWRITILMTTALALALISALAYGAERLPFDVLFCQIFTAHECNFSDVQRTIFYGVRLPRVLVGACVGSCLATAGAAYQSLLRNPLAEPYLLGVSNGAAIGAMFALVFFGANALARPLFAFIGAGIASAIVYIVARGRSGMNVERLALSGVMVTTFLSALIVLATSLLDATRLRSFTFWLLGDLSTANAESLYFLLPILLVCAGILLTQSRALNLLMLGERDAFDFGVEIGRTRLLVFSAASLLVGAAVASSGSVGFVGLVVPHIVRRLTGSDNRFVLFVSAFGGAIFVALADTLARSVIAPRELPVGAITALVGAPLFVLLLNRESKSFNPGKFAASFSPTFEKDFADHAALPVQNAPQKEKIRLKAEKISLGYGACEVLRDISFSLERGKIFAILGTNGAGKSSLVKSLNGSIKPLKGLLTLDEENLNEFSRRDVAQKIAVAAQENETKFPLTVLEFVLYGRFAARSYGFENEKDLQTARRALAETDLQSFENRLMNALSGGERQRVVLARALATQAEIILLDEPTANLDLRHQIETLRVVRRKCCEKKLSAVLVTHDLNLAAHFADEILLLHKGAAFAQGTPEDVLTAENIRQVFGVNAFLDANPLDGTMRVSLDYRKNAD